MLKLGFGAFQKKQDAKEFCYSSEFLRLVIKHLGSCVSSGKGLSNSERVLSHPYNAHDFHPPALLGILAAVKETYVVDGTFSKKDKEVLASFLAVFNESTHCKDVHMQAAVAEGSDSSTLHQALQAKDPLLLPDRKLGKIVEWWIAAQTRGVPDTNWVPSLTQEQCTELISVAFLSNFTSCVTVIFNSWHDVSSKGTTCFRGFSQLMQKTKGYLKPACLGDVSKEINYSQYTEDPSTLMDRFPEIPGDFSWVGENKALATAYAYWAWSMDEMAMTYIPANVEEFVKKYINENFHGTDMQMPKTWAFNVSENLEGTEAEKFGAGFMLMIVFARADIDDDILKTLMKHYMNSRARRALVLWSAFQAARTIASWQNKKLQTK